MWGGIGKEWKREKEKKEEDELKWNGENEKNDEEEDKMENNKEIWEKGNGMEEKKNDNNVSYCGDSGGSSGVIIWIFIINL